LTKIFVDFDEGFRQYSRMASKPPRPTEAELAILQVLWTHGPLSVREIQRVINQTKETGYTTVLKLIQIMTEKGLVTRDESVRPQIYQAKYSRQHTQRRLVGELMQRAFGGSVKALVLQALADTRSSPEDLRAMEELLDRMEAGKGAKK
jgi:predicted transcriptional regulator